MSVRNRDKYNKGDIFLRKYPRVKGIQEGSWVLGVVTSKAVSPKAVVIYYDPIKVVGDIEAPAAVSSKKGEAYFIVGTGFESRIVTKPYEIVHEVFKAWER